MKVLLPVILVLAAAQLPSIAQSAGTNKPLPAVQASMYTRAYRVETNVFTVMRRSITATNHLLDPAVLRSYCKQNGVDLSPPASVFYTYGEKSLVVRSTLVNLDKLEELLAELSPGK